MPPMSRSVFYKLWMLRHDSLMSSSGKGLSGIGTFHMRIAEKKGLRRFLAILRYGLFG